MEQTQLLSRNVNYLRAPQRQLLSDEVKGLKEQLKNPDIHFKGRVVKRIKAVEEQIEKYSPKEVRGDVRDKVSRRVKELVDKVRGGMLTNEELRKAPVGSVDRLRKWERFHKHDIIELKNGLLTLAVGQGDYSGDEMDIANLEKFRPWGSAQGYRANAIVEGHMAFQNPAAQEGFDLVFPEGPTADTAYKQALRASGIAVDARKKILSDEERAKKREWLAKARAVLKEKRAAATLEESVQGTEA